MSWRVEWKALSDRIHGLLDASHFYLELKSIASVDYWVVEKQLLPQIKNIFEDLEHFINSNKNIIPDKAFYYGNEFINQFHGLFNDKGMEKYGAIQFRITSLVSFCTEFTYHISDSSEATKRLSERAFLHLQRSIVADPFFRTKWKNAFNKNEPECEKLGAIHLLQHGIWAFKINAEGERTDLVFNEIIQDLNDIERTAEALVLTEWKRAKSKSEVDKKIAEAKQQTIRYASGTLGGIELTNYRYIVIVTEKVVAMPLDEHRENTIYRHINIAVNPNPPSKR